MQRRLEQLRQLAAEKQDIRPNQVDMRNRVATLIQDGSYIDAGFDEVKYGFGTVDNYLRDG